jgi:hypothetical protein
VMQVSIFLFRRFNTQVTQGGRLAAKHGKTRLNNLEGFPCHAVIHS